MIYTITFNPALDYTVQVEKFEIGKINRTKSENILAGGKGLNVSIILKRLGIENTALSFIAGFTGKELERKIIDFDNNYDGKKINQATAKIYFNAINKLINKNTGRHYNINNAYLCELTLNKVDNFILDELEELDKLKNTDNKE